MPCTTFLVGKLATVDGSTMISRTDDGHFDVKKMVVVSPKDQPTQYESKISHLKITLPDNPLRYTACPSVDLTNGVWAATGINSKNVGMTATETVTSNSRVLAADPYVVYNKETNTPGGIGEEDIVILVLPYINSAKEGVLRLGALLEQYGTYEPNGIAFNDDNEVWWLETIGGHHWIARRVQDEEYVIMPNQFGLDRFDFNDAFKDQKDNLCSKDLKEFMINNHIDANLDGEFNPRLAFGSHSDADHVYNTPRGWFMARYFNPRTFIWDGIDAEFTPESDDIPWALRPERKIDVEEVKYILSSYYQGTEYNPYGRGNSPKKGMYRPIGISRTGVTTILQIRPYMPEAIKSVEWLMFGSNAFNAMMPLYANVDELPTYVKNTTLDVNTNSFYWNSRLLGVLADAHYGATAIHIERYQNAVLNKTREILLNYDKKMLETGDFSELSKANQDLSNAVEKETQKTLNKIVLSSSEEMKNGYHRFDN